MKYSTKEDVRPAFQFYPDDWLGSVEDLRLCSPAAKGVWIDFICIMHKSPKKGALLTAKGRQYTIEELSGICTFNNAKLMQDLISELSDKEVFSRLEDGTIICRRVFYKAEREEQIRKKRIEAANKRWGKKKSRKQKKVNANGMQNNAPGDTDTEVLSSKDVSNSGKEGAGGKGKKEIPPYQEIITYLNEKAGTAYRHSSEKTKDLIDARWNNGFRLGDFKIVIEKKVTEWKKPPKPGEESMAKYIRPETLFGTKFESYLNQLDVAGETNDPGVLSKAIADLSKLGGKKQVIKWLMVVPKNQWSELRRRYIACYRQDNGAPASFDAALEEMGADNATGNA